MQTETVSLPHVTAPSWNVEIDLVDRPTPFLMVDLEQVSAAYSSLQAALPDFRILYAMKANPQPEVLDALAQEGSGFEVASATELTTLLDRDIPADGVMFSNPVKAPLDIRMGHDCGVSAFALDSDAEIIKLALEAPGSAVYVRIATTGSGSRFPLSKRFGVGPREAVELLKLARNFGLVPYGCTFMSARRTPTRAAGTSRLRTVHTSCASSSGFMGPVCRCSISAVGSPLSTQRGVFPRWRSSARP